MADYAVESLRNIAVVGHNAAGKTTLVEHLLFKAGRTNRLGSVDDKTSILDYEDQERERRVTIDSALAWLEWKKNRFNLLDCPGSLDFVADAIGGLQAVETALITVAAPAGIELNTRRMWKAAAARARMIVITKMDADNITDHDATLAKIQEVFGASCVPVNVPLGVGASFKGVASVLDPNQKAEGIDEARTQLMDVIAESDEALMERYLNEEKITADEIAAALRKAVAAGKVVPIFHCSGRSGAGLEELLDGLAALAPSPLDVAPRKGANAKDGAEVEIKPDPAAPLVAQVFKSITDPFVGKLAYFRVFAGSFKADSTVFNSRSGRNERVGQVLKPFGKDTESVPVIATGDFGAVSKIDDVQIGDVFCPADHAVKMASAKYPTPMVSLAVMPRSRNDEQKIGQSVAKLTTECPTFNFNRDTQTHELVVTGMSQRHVDVMIARLKSRFQVEVDTKEPKIPYKETISANGESQYRHKKQTGGSGQFAEVWLKTEPMERGAGFEFVDEVVGGAIPNQFIPAIEKGVREQMAKGILAGCVIEDVRVKVYFGKYHPVDSNEQAFKTASAMAFTLAFNASKPVLLEPVVRVDVTVPSQYMGAITGDLNGRRGRIVGMEAEGDLQTISAEVPLAEVLRYATELSSMTGGVGAYTMEFCRYDIVPTQAAQKVIAAAKAAKENA